MKFKSEPTPFDAKRAKEIMAQTGPFGDLSKSDMTPGEDAYVSLVWGKMPGYTCWMDALNAIRRGKVTL